VNNGELSGYTVLKQVCCGGITEILLARAPDDRKVIIRRLLPHHRLNRSLRRRFINGILIQQQMNHPNIPKVYALHKHGPQPYMIGEYIPGENLLNLLFHRHPLLKKHPLCLIRKLAEALQYVHVRGFLHLDVKPENIMVLLEKADPMLIDYDMALPWKGRDIRLSKPGGTPAYMAPEIFTRKIVNEKSDTYSFGIVAHQILTGMKPGDAQARGVGSPTDPRNGKGLIRELNPSVDPRFEAVINKCIAKNPVMRYPSMSLVIHDLNSLL